MLGGIAYTLCCLILPRNHAGFVTVMAAGAAYDGSWSHEDVASKINIVVIKVMIRHLKSRASDR